MKPHRIRMTHNLLLNYGLYRKMEIYVSPLSFLLQSVLYFFSLLPNTLLSNTTEKGLFCFTLFLILKRYHLVLK